MTTFGRNMQAAWALDPAITYLNHGTVGAPPRRVLEAQQRLRDEIERQPAKFLLRDLSAIRVGQPSATPGLLRQAADAVGAFLGFLELPVAVGQRFVMQHDLVQLLALQAQADAQRRKRDTGNRKQEARADRERMRVVAGAFGAAAGDEAVGAAERGGEDHEGADGSDQPGMATAEAAYA